LQIALYAWNTANNIYCIFDGTVLPVPFEGPLLADFVGKVIDEFKSKRGITIIGGVNVFRISRTDGEELEENAAFDATSKVKLKTIAPLDTALLAGGAHLILLERKPGEFLCCCNRAGHVPKT